MRKQSILALGSSHLGQAEAQESKINQLNLKSGEVPNEEGKVSDFIAKEDL